MHFTSLFAPSFVLIATVSGAALPGKNSGGGGSTTTTTTGNPITFSSDIISTIVNMQNAERLARGVPNAVWNTQLASRAQNWATACQFAHTTSVAGGGSEPGTRPGPEGTMGENIIQQSPSFDVTTMMQWWINEKNDTPQGGHYLAMVYSGWTQVGCGAANCGTTRSPFVIGVCNYMYDSGPF